MRSSNRRMGSSWLWLAAVVAVGGAGNVAAAQDGSVMPAGEGAVVPAQGYSLVNAQRPLTLDQGRLRIDASLGFVKVCFSAGTLSACTEVFVGLAAGASYGITDDLEVGAMVLPLTLSPEVKYGNPSVYGQYRMVGGDVEVAARAEVWLPVEGDFRLQVGAPIWWKASPSVALRTGAFLMFVASDPNQMVISIPVALVINATDNFWLGISTGLSFAVSDPGPGDTLAVPLGLELGYALADSGGAPLVDLVGSWQFTSFIAGGGGDTISASSWVASLGARIYLDTAQ